ncbi:MAG TPA: HAD-IC family P-type ATPase [Candidatus Methylomirabilis sp.]|nr:HAD-IC family P-type ATPase [Candidatus Methylomirabilis sp.]
MSGGEQHRFTVFTTQDAATVLASFGTSLERGLTTADVDRARASHGWNEIRARESTWRNILARQFRSSFVYLLIAAAALSFALGEAIDGSFILLFVVINAGLGFYQEFRSDQTLRLLCRYMVSRAMVRRDNREVSVESRELVPGDIVLLTSGNIVPADIRILREHGLTIDESVLTGESAQARKTADALVRQVSEPYEAANIAFAGSVVVSGKVEGVVVATGRASVMGGVSELSAETMRESSFEKGIDRFSRFILRVIVITLLLVFVANVVLKGERGIVELVIFSIALAVSIIPEALPVVTTFSLSRGALRLAKNKVVVKRLSAIEDLGSIEILCTDKTGTLTENRLEVAEISSRDTDEALFYAALAAHVPKNGSKEHADAFDAALWRRIAPVGRKRCRACTVLNDIPFDPVRRRNSLLAEIDGVRELVVRGAPEVLMDAANVSRTDRERHHRWMAEQGALGRRVLAVARKRMDGGDRYSVDDETRGFDFLGIVSFIDPVKKTAKSAIEKARALGVTIKIVTGDSREVAGAVAFDVGLVPSIRDVITGEELEALSEDDQHAAVERYSVFARVSPEQKYRIIHLLERDHEVGFLGEGINDAPALKIANVGLVVQHAADAAREAADIVLLHKSLTVIVDGIREGRDVFANTTKYIQATLSSNFGNFFAIAVASLLVPYLPLLPLQILLLNLFTDFPMIAVSTDRVDPKEIRKPRMYQVHEIALLAIILGVVSSLFDFIFFAVFQRMGQSVLQTNWFIGSVLTELLFLFSIRTKGWFWKGTAPSRTLLWLTLAVIAITVALPFTFVGQTLFRFAAPTTTHLFMIFGIAAAYLTVTESVKVAYERFANPRVVA